MYRPPRTHFHMDKEASAVLGFGNDGGGLQHSFQSWPAFWFLLRHSPHQRVTQVIAGLSNRFELSLSSHFFVSLLIRQKISTLTQIGEVWQNIKVEYTHLAPMDSSATTISLSFRDLTMSHMQKLSRTKSKVWLSGAVRCKYLLDNLKVSQIFASLRCQPEHIDHLKNGVFVLKGEGNFDSTNKPERLGKVSLSYVHCIDHNWFVGTEVRTDIESRRRGPTLRDQELRTFLGMKSPEVKIGTWYRWTDPDVVFRLRVKAQNGFNNLNVKGRIEKTFPEHSLTPFFHFTFNPFSTDTFEFGVGVNLGSCY